MATPNPDETALKKIALAVSASPEKTISFAQLMEIALYDEEVGYYASGIATIGRRGDFFTSVSSSDVEALSKTHSINIVRHVGIARLTQTRRQTVDA